MKWSPFLVASIALLIGACSDLPKDPDGTLERVTRERRFRVGLIAAGEGGAVHERQRAMLARAAAATGARPVVETDAAEPLMVRLGEAEIDLVLGEFQVQGPWSTHVHMLPSFASRQVAGQELLAAAAAPAGENRWIMLLDREARALGGKP